MPRPRPRSRRSRNRLSRRLIGALGITIVTGGAVYGYRHYRAAPVPLDTQISLKAVDAATVGADGQPIPSPGPASDLASPGARALVTQTPTGPGPAVADAIGVAHASEKPSVASAVAPPADAPLSKPAQGDPVAPALGTPSDPLAASRASAGSSGSSLAIATGSAVVATASVVRPVSLAQSAPVPTSAAGAAKASASPQVAASHLAGTPDQALADAKAKIDAGDLLGARTVLNDQLLSDKLGSADATQVRQELSGLNQTIFFSKKRIKDDPFQVLYQIQSGDRLARIADRHAVTWELLCRINGLSDPRKIRAGQWIKIPRGPFYCVITKSAFRLDLFLGSPGETDALFIRSFAVGLGKENSTPTGLWVLQQGSKAHPATYYSPRGEGVIAADDPKNPLGGYWMGLSGLSGAAVDKNSYGIHGTIEPDSIGKQASMGCIRLGHDDIAFLYDLLVDGKSKVLVKD